MLSITAMTSSIVVETQTPRIATGSVTPAISSPAMRAPAGVMSLTTVFASCALQPGTTSAVNTAAVARETSVLFFMGRPPRESLPVADRDVQPGGRQVLPRVVRVGARDAEQVAQLALPPRVVLPQDLEGVLP